MSTTIRTRPGCPPPPPTLPRPSARERIRPEIQALRAAAVSLVVLSHAWPDAVPGGFVGIDMFFAISGFLITSHLLREVGASCTVSLAAFWARRARRILPAALLTLLVCSLATIAIVPQNEWEQYLAEIRASALFVQNWHLAAESVDYFGVQDQAGPVQHLWSLSVEEQFYLVWPVAILAVATATRRRSAAVVRRTIGVVLGAIAVASFAYSLHVTGANPASAYFQTPARAWEFAAGGLLALLPLTAAQAAVRAALSWTGILAIAVAVVAYDGSTPFPGSAALLPVLGAIAIMRAGTPDVRWAPTAALRVRPVQFVGDVSYAIYLWHWPLLLLAPVAAGAPVGDPAKAGLVALTLLAAWATKLAIEDPIRRSRALAARDPRLSLGAAAIGAASILALTAGPTHHARAEAQAAELRTQQIVAAKPQCFGAAAADPGKPCENPALHASVVPTPAAARRQSNSACRPLPAAGGPAACAFGVRGGPASTTIALVGDSHASHWRAALDVAAARRGWRGVSVTRTGCPFSAATKRLREPMRGSCADWKAGLPAFFRRHPEITTVFVSQMAGGVGVVASPGTSEFDARVRGYRDAWASLPPSVREIVVIRDTPKVDGDTDTCVQQALGGDRPPGEACAVPRAAAIERDPAAAAAAASRTDRARVVDLTDLLCGGERCRPVIGGVLVYKDQNHLTSTFAATLGPYLARRIGRLQ